MPGTVSVLIACTANICRSPSAALLLHRGLAEHGLADLFTVTTAGTEATTGRPYCASSAGLARADDTLRREHRSRRIAVEDVRDADVVLVLARDHRGAVARLLPQAATRTFTLLEADALARAVTRAPDGLTPATPGPDPAARAQAVRDLVARMNDARGTVPLEPRPRTLSDRLRRRDPVHPHDIPDPHLDRGTTHRDTVAQIEQALTGLVTSLDAALGGRRPATPTP